jgi:hypothetical protein
MAQFSSPDTYRRFEQAAMRKMRHVYDSEVRHFLAAIGKSTMLWRAQWGYIPGAPKIQERKKSLKCPRIFQKAEFVCDGRVNARGTQSIVSLPTTLVLIFICSEHAGDTSTQSCRALRIFPA